jgi:hypothetical protein
MFFHCAILIIQRVSQKYGGLRLEACIRIWGAIVLVRRGGPRPGAAHGEKLAKKIGKRLKRFALGQKDAYNKKISQLISNCGNPSS